MINASFFYIVDRRASGDSTHGTTSLWEAIEWLRRDSHKSCCLIILDYDAGRIAAKYDFAPGAR
jgi:hypothetical protein